MTTQQEQLDITNKFINLRQNNKVKQGTWKNIENHKIYMDWLGLQLGYKTFDDWYKISCKDIKNNYGGGLLQYYNGSPSHLVISVYSEENWLPWKFTSTFNGYWEARENHKIYADWLGTQLGYKTPEDWYKINLKDITNNYGGGLLQYYYNGSPLQLVISVYPEENWLPWKFTTTSNGYWKDRKNHKIYMDWLGTQLGYKTPDDWYKINLKDIINNNGCALLHYYNDSPLQILISVYPEENWLPWKFTLTSNGYWKDKKNQKIYMDWLGLQLGYKTPEDWYKISQKDIINNNGDGLLHYYNGSPLQILISVYPEKTWLPWKFTTISMGYWKDKNNHKIYMDWLGLQLGYKTPEDWYKINLKDIINNNGCTLVHYYNDSPLQILKSVYPEENWLPWKFIHTPKDYWKDKKNQIIYMDWLGLQLGYKTPDDWYKINIKDITNNYGCTLVHYYNGSPTLLVISVYPEENWLPWKFTLTYTGYWKDKKNHKIYADWLGTQLRYKTPEDWYKINYKDITNNYGGGLLVSYYNSSPSQLVISIYPEENWFPWKFTTISMGYWKDKKNHKIYMDWLGKELGYKTLDDWYKITTQRIINNYGGGLLVCYYNNSAKLFVTSIYPDYPWNLSKFQKNYSQGQIEWLNCLIIKKYPDIRHALNHDKGEYSIPNSGYFSDGYSKTKNTILEYHGDYYHGNPKFYNLEELNKRTKTTYGELYENTLQKQRFCEEGGYNYISIWESEWFRFKNSIILLQRLFKDKKEFL